jgi:hypothetical protein
LIVLLSGLVIGYHIYLCVIEFRAALYRYRLRKKGVYHAEPDDYGQPVTKGRKVKPKRDDAEENEDDSSPKKKNLIIKKPAKALKKGEKADLSTSKAPLEENEDF